MRLNIVHEGADELNYEIRQIVVFGSQLEAMGLPMIWENIGDPVTKGELVPQWMRDIIASAIQGDVSTLAYSPTKGLITTRQFLSDLRQKEDGVVLDPENILFFNGLGDAVSKVYSSLNRNVRVIGPSPAYPTHSSAEAAHAGSHHLTYQLDPDNGWLPDMQDLSNKIKYNPSIAGILIINPDNPTGMVYPRKVLAEIVALARHYRLFLIADEIYSGLAYGSEPFVPLASLVADVPTIVMRGLSKELPWPGSRCGWIEVYNGQRDVNFARYFKSLVDAKMLEVCSTTLPQAVMPTIMSDSRYPKHLQDRRDRYRLRANKAIERLGGIDGIDVVEPGGAFYLTVRFKPGALRGHQTLNVEHSQAKKLVEETASALTASEYDKRFCYYLMAARGLCVVPLSGFNTDLSGFRMTLLEPDDEKFEQILDILSSAIKDYLASKSSTAV